MIVQIFALLVIAACGVFCFCVFFDQAVLTRKGTVYRVKTSKKKIAITFDDGPSPIWTPHILDKLHSAQIPATFFMLGHHVKQYPEVAKRVAAEGHEIGNHGYAHNVLVYYKPEELEEEIRYTELLVQQTTGQVTRYFRPPKAWLGRTERAIVRSMGYAIVLWSLNSKDWVPFNSRRIVEYVLSHAQSGDIILFHDSGDVFRAEGGDRLKTLAAIEPLAAGLRQRGFECVTVGELLTERVL